MRLKKQKKIVLYLQMLQHTKLYLSFSKISASALFLNLFFKFRKFQPRYSYKIYYKKGVYLFVEGRGSRVTSRGSRVNSRGSRVYGRGSRVTSRGSKNF